MSERKQVGLAFVFCYGFLLYKSVGSIMNGAFIFSLIQVINLVGIFLAFCYFTYYSVEE